MLERFHSADDAARAAVSMLRASEPLSQVWRFAIAQLLYDYGSVLRHQGRSAAAAMWRFAPGPTADARVDAALAALAEHLARRDGWTVPQWSLDPALEAMPWWFVSDLRGMHPKALVESPPSFRRRGVFITAGALERV